MIGPLKLLSSLLALVLVSVLLVALSTSPAAAGPEGGPAPGQTAPGNGPTPHEWVMAVLLFALVIGLRHHRTAGRQRA